MLSPVVLFVYNRPWHTRQTLESLQKNVLSDQSVLFIYSDGAPENATQDQLRKIAEVRKIIRERSWCKEIHIVESEKNKGLANSIISGVTDIVNNYGKVIVLEDDIVTSNYFLKFCNEGLDKYESEDRVKAISGFMFPVSKKLQNAFFLPWFACWGWATWKRSWNAFEPNSLKLLKEIEKERKIKDFNFNNSYDFYGLLQAQNEGRVNSWAIRWFASIFLKQGLTFYPPGSLVQNIGIDGSGTHYNESAKEPKNNKKIASSKINFRTSFNFPVIIESNKKLEKYLNKYLKKESSGRSIDRIKNYLRKVLC